MESAPPDPDSPASRRVAALLTGPPLPTLLRLAAPNIALLLSQALANVLESYYVGLLGVEPLAGVALVFPLVMLMQMMSAGGIGGGISSAIARALGAGRREDAEALAFHALIVALVLGLATGLAILLSGRLIYGAMGGRGEALEAALAFSNVFFAGSVFLWLANAQASILRGTGDMRLPALVLTLGALGLVGLSPILIFGLGPVPGLGVAGAGLAMVTLYVVSGAVLAWRLASGAEGIRPRLRQRPRWTHFSAILRVGGPAVVNNLTTNLSMVLATSLIAPLGAPALAGFGLGLRLEYLQIPIVFGIGSGMVAMVAMNIGAGQRVRARQIAWTGALVAFAVTETIGLAVAVFPEAWLRLFTDDPEAIAVGAAYFRAVGPAFGLLGLGLSLYFASQGLGRMGWSVLGGLARVAIVGVGGWLAMAAPGDRLGTFLGVLVLALAAFAVANTIPWLRRPKA